MRRRLEGGSAELMDHDSAARSAADTVRGSSRYSCARRAALGPPDRQAACVPALHSEAVLFSGHRRRGDLRHDRDRGLIGRRGVEDTARPPPAEVGPGPCPVCTDIGLAARRVVLQVRRSGADLLLCPPRAIAPGDRLLSPALKRGEALKTADGAVLFPLSSGVSATTLALF